MSVKVSSENLFDSLQKLSVFYAKREGIDKALKLIRYSIKVYLEGQDGALLKDKGTWLQRLSLLEKSIGVSRKSLRLGKFSQSLVKLILIRSSLQQQKIGPLKIPGMVILDILANSGECVYQFLEQFVWLYKTGFLQGDGEGKVSRIGAYWEVIGYIGSVTAMFIKLGELQEQILQLKDAQEQRLLQSNAKLGQIIYLESKNQYIWPVTSLFFYYYSYNQPQQQSQNSENIANYSLNDEDVKLKKVQLQYQKEFFNLIKDFSDCLLTAKEFGGDNYFLSQRQLSMLGIVSALVSCVKYWP